MSAKRPKFSYPVPANNRGHAFSTAEELLAKLGGESSGQYLVGSQGMWHGGIHITDATIPWCALSARTEAEQQYRREPYQGEQFIRCMADGDIVAWRVCKDYQSAAIPWREENLYMSTSFVLVKHAIQLGDTAASGLTFYTLYMNLAPFSAYIPQGGEQGRRTAGVQRYYNSADDVRAGNSAGKLIADTPVMLTDGVVTRSSDQRQFSKVVLVNETVTAAGGILAAGSAVWTVSDQGALSADASALSPHWWRKCVPAYGPQPASAVKASQPVFGEVVIPPVPIAINAGDNIGHLGFYQLPEENGKRSRYQAHIECLSMDANLPDFLKNPDRVGEQEPAYLKYPQAAPLFVKNAGGQMVDSTRKTRTQGIATLFNVPVEKIDGQPAYYQIHRESGWLAAASVQKLSQYALAELGFITLDKAPESFDLIDGSKHPDNVVKGILERLYQAAQDETRTSHALNKYNYKRLLEMIDSQRDGHYSEKEYLQAVHNVSYRDYLYRIIVKHASEWYYGKHDPLWKTYLDTLTLDAPQWKTYTEALIDNMTWMKKVDGMGPEPWHMHPVVFCSALMVNDRCEITVEMIEKLLGHKNPWFTGKSGGKTFAKNFQMNYPNVYEFDKFTFVNLLNKYMAEYKIIGPYHKAHFLSQCLHESAHLDTTLEFGSGKNYDPGQHPDALKYENTNIDDGPKYRGRGLIQLTWKKNYRIFSQSSGCDFITKPDLVAAEMAITIKASAWFWRNNGAISSKFNAKGDINILIDNDKNNVQLITKAVNGGNNGLKERERYFNEIKKMWGLD
jgi:predicted chitinase